MDSIPSHKIISVLQSSATKIFSDKWCNSVHDFIQIGDVDCMLFCFSYISNCVIQSSFNNIQLLSLVYSYRLLLLGLIWYVVLYTRRQCFGVVQINGFCPYLTSVHWTYIHVLVHHTVYYIKIRLVLELWCMYYRKCNLISVCLFLRDSIFLLLNTTRKRNSL